MPYIPGQVVLEGAVGMFVADWPAPTLNLFDISVLANASYVVTGASIALNLTVSPSTTVTVEGLDPT